MVPVPSCDNGKRKFKLIIAASIGLEEDGKVARMQTDGFNLMVNQRLCFIFVFCKQNRNRLAVNSVVERVGKGRIFFRDY